MAGIWLAEILTPLGSASVLALAFCVALALAASIVASRRLLQTGNKLYRALSAALLLLPAAGAGLLRHQAAVFKPPNDVTRLLANEPLLTRLAGEVASTPISAPGQRRNPFIRADLSPRTQFVLAARELRTVSPPAPLCGRIRVSVDGEGLGLRLGDQVQLTGKLYRPLPPRNPGEFDWAHWNYLQGIEAGLVVEGSEYLQRVGDAPSWSLRLVAAARDYAHRLLLGSYGDEPPDATGRLLDTLVLGQRTAADRELNELFLRAGGLHFLAVSGFNVAVLAGAVCWVMRGVLRCRARSTAAVTLGLVIWYGVVAEPNAPILRATVLGVLVALSGLTRRPAVILNGLAAGALTVLLMNPLEVFRPGFQLSFIQVLALITVIPGVSRVLLIRVSGPKTSTNLDRPRTEANTWRAFAWMKLWRGTAALALLCTVAWLIATPLVLFHYGRLAPWGILGTFLLTLPVTLVTWLGVLTIAVQAVYPPGAALAGPALQWLTAGLLWLVRCFAGAVSPGVIEFTTPPAWLVFATYAVLLLTVVLSGRIQLDELTGDFRAMRSARRRSSGDWCGTLMVLLLAWVGWYLWPQRAGVDYELHVLSVGKGNTIMLLNPARDALLFDIGTDRNLDVGETAAQAARVLGVKRLAGIAISHANTDHYSGLSTLLERLSSESFILSDYTARGYDGAPALAQAFKPPERAKLVRRAHAGDQFALAGMPIEVLWPPADLDAAGWSLNDLSLVLRVHAGARTILFTGDIEGHAMRELLAADAAGTIRLASDVLIAPHHGSVVPESAAFYAAVAPELVLVSAAEERPRFTELLERILRPCDRWTSTAGAGAISLVIRPDGELRVTAPREAGGSHRGCGCVGLAFRSITCAGSGTPAGSPPCLCHESLGVLKIPLFPRHRPPAAVGHPRAVLVHQHARREPVAARLLPPGAPAGRLHQVMVKLMEVYEERELVRVGNAQPVCLAPPMRAVGLGPGDLRAQRIGVAHVAAEVYEDSCVAIKARAREIRPTAIPHADAQALVAIRLAMPQKQSEQALAVQLRRIAKLHFRASALRAGA